MKKNSLKKSVLLASAMMLGICVTPAKSHATETSVTTAEAKSGAGSFQLGLLGGPAVNPEALTFSNAMAYGARAEYKPTAYLGVGVFAMHSDYGSSDFLFATQNLQQNLIGAEAKLYPFSSNGLYLGARAAAALTKATVNVFGDSASNTRTDVMVGGSVGYNIELMKSVTLAPEVSYLRSVSADGGGGQVLSTVMNLNFWL